MTEPKRGRGRPPKPVEDRRRNNVTIRLRDATKARLEIEAEQSGRSISDEVETVLERSFDRGDLLSEVLTLRFGKPLAGLLLAMGGLAANVGRHCRDMKPKPRPREWTEDGFAVAQAVAAMKTLLDAFPIPEEGREPPDYRWLAPGLKWDEARREREVARDMELPTTATIELIEAIKGNVPASIFAADGVEKIAALLGPVGSGLTPPLATEEWKARQKSRRSRS